MSTFETVTVKCDAKKGYMIFIDIDADSAGWPTWSFASADDSNGTEIDFVEFVAQFLADDEVAIFVDDDNAEAINNKLDRRFGNPLDIHGLAQELGLRITETTF